LQSFKVFTKRIYAIFYVLYNLWLVSAFLIFLNKGFKFSQDLPWFFLFTTILFIAWLIKFLSTNDKKILFYADITPGEIWIYILIFLLVSIWMVFGSVTINSLQ
tara:strand:+ start:1161 stop:1472 length:312 start_codon:yes stop_codon:yes gene_type:complete